MEEASLSQQDFAVRLGISPGSLSSIFTGRTKPTNNHVQAVHRAFPDININWLLFGEGEMRSGTVSDGTSTGLEKLETGMENLDGVLPMFTDESVSGTPRSDERMPKYPAGRRDAYVSRPTVPYPMNSEKKNDNIRRKIKEIRVFFDDGTYEAFVPSGK